MTLLTFYPNHVILHSSNLNQFCSPTVRQINDFALMYGTSTWGPYPRFLDVTIDELETLCEILEIEIRNPVNWNRRPLFICFFAIEAVN